jgi:hypothetical protein
MINLNSSLMAQVISAAKAMDHTPDAYVAYVLHKHLEDEAKAKMPRPKEVLIANVGQLAPGTEFIITDVMDSLHKGFPDQRRNYGQALSLQIARRVIKATFTGRYDHTFKIYRKD